MKRCLYCNQEFEPKNPKGKFCSSKCKVASSRSKKAAKDAGKEKANRNQSPKKETGDEAKKSLEEQFDQIIKNKYHTDVFAGIKITAEDKLPSRLDRMKQLTENRNK